MEPDPLLSEEGKSRAISLGQTKNPLLFNADLVVVSPLSRAIQTTLGIYGEDFKSHKTKFCIEPLASECSRASTHGTMWYTCNSGRPGDELVKDYPSIANWEGFEKL